MNSYVKLFLRTFVAAGFIWLVAWFSQPVYAATYYQDIPQAALIPVDTKVLRFYSPRYILKSSGDILVCEEQYNNGDSGKRDCKDAEGKNAWQRAQDIRLRDYPGYRVKYLSLEYSSLTLYFSKD